MSNLTEFAKDELRRAGLYDQDSDYNGMLGDAVEKLVEVFAAQDHSGMSASITLAAFDRVARWKPLSPITSDPSEWHDVSEYSGGPMWQSRRSPSTFSKDGGQTWYDLDDSPPATQHEDAT